MKKQTILNVCGGKILPIFDEDNKNVRDTFILNVDTMYLSGSFNEARNNHFKFIKDIYNESYSSVYYLDHNIYDFLERYDLPFDKICIYRFLEHVPKSEVLYFIYLLSTCTKLGADIDVIVPDYNKLAERILKEDPFSKNFEADDILTTYELLNDKNSPHLSIWTRKRLIKFFELEGRFKVMRITESYNFDGRDIYLRAEIKRL